MVFRKTFGVTQIARKNDVMLFEVSSLRLLLLKSFLNSLFDDSKKIHVFFLNIHQLTAFPNMWRQQPFRICRKKKERERKEYSQN